VSRPWVLLRYARAGTLLIALRDELLGSLLRRLQDLVPMNHQVLVDGILACLLVPIRALVAPSHLTAPRGTPRGIGQASLGGQNFVSARGRQDVAGNTSCSTTGRSPQTRR